jgi:hypothetical protein
LGDHLGLKQQPETVAQLQLHLVMVNRQRPGLVEDGVDQRAQHHLKPEGNASRLGGFAALAHDLEQGRRCPMRGSAKIPWGVDSDQV